MVSYESMKIINVISLQMSGKQIPIYTKAKRKIHNNLDHKNTAPTLLILRVYLQNCHKF